MSAEIADVLDRAAEVIETRGWHQGFYAPVNATDFMSCPVCVLGAIAAATQNGDPDFEKTTPGTSAYWAADALGRVVDPEWGAVDEWNDRPGRTADEVTAALRNAAAAERAS